MTGAVVSVIVPAYNRAATIAACVESIRAQTHAAWEAIIVDDGSVDGTQQVAERAARGDARVRVIRLKHNYGAQAARNAGLRAAGGDWIAFLDSDDRYLPDSMERRLDAAGGLDVVHSECEVLRADGTRGRFGVPAMSGRAYRDVLSRPGPMFQGLLVRRRAFDRVGPLDEAIVAYQEWDTAIRLAEHFDFGFVAEPTFVYDCRSGNRISSDARRAVRGYEQVLRKHWRAMLRHGGIGALAGHLQGVIALRRATREAGP